jgi:putative ABC transport system substrate-binding protein
MAGSPTQFKNGAPSVVARGTGSAIVLAVSRRPTATSIDAVLAGYDENKSKGRLSDIFRASILPLHCDRPILEGDGMKRREFITLVGGAAVTWPLPLRAQEAGKFYRVAYLTLAGGQDAVIVKQRLNELGYREGKNLIFDYRSAEGQLERLPQLAAESVATNPDVIVTGFGTETAKAAQAATATIPIVFTSVGDPIGAGIVKSLNRPSANITGLTSQAAEISGKRLQILQQLSPGIRIVAVIVSPGYPFTAVALPQLMTGAEARGLRLEICEVRTADQLPASVEAAVKAGATGLTILETPVLHGFRQQIADLAAKRRLFAIYTSRDFVDDGGLMSYGTDRRQQYRRAAELVDKILKGEKPADIPVEQPTKFELVINLKTAKALGIDVPLNLLATADEVIE